MLLPLIALSFCGVRNVISASDVRQPRTPQTTAPPAISHDYEKRDGAAATVIGGEASAWFPTAPSGGPKPTGMDFSLQASDTDPGGFDVFVGKDLKDSFNKILKEKCQDPRNENCHKELQGLFKQDQIDSHKRQFGLIAAFALFVKPLIIGAVLGIVTGLIIHKIGEKLAEDNWHVPADNAAPILPSTTASAVAIASATNDPNPLTIAVPSDVELDEGPVMKGESNGDLTINLSKDLATRLDDLIAQNSGNCPQPENKRDLHSIDKRDLPPDVLACLTVGMVILIKNIYNGALGEMARLHQQGRVAARPPEAGALLAIADAGRQVAGIQQSLRLDDESWRQITVGAYWSVYNREVAKQHDNHLIRIKKEAQDQSLQRFCPPKELLRCSAQSCSGKDGKCAEDAKWFAECDCEEDETGCPKLEAMPFCDNCGGRSAVGQSCKGLEGGGLQDCACIVADKTFEGQQRWSSGAEFDKWQKAFDNLPDVPNNPDNNNPHCELRKRDLLNVEPALFKSIVKHAVCKDFVLDINTSFDKTLTKDDASKDDGNWDGYTDWKFHFKFDDRPPVCLDFCETIYDTFADNTDCAAEHSMHPSGKIILACGDASYEIIPPSATPPPPPPEQGCPDPHPTISDGIEAFDKWNADPKNKCDRCPGGKYDFCSIGESTCQCTDKECADLKRYMCYT
ncbi:MAG: hypothetical protein Q9160_000889 [Pyrenula sp. 1 TL-2023]